MVCTLFAIVYVRCCHSCSPFSSMDKFVKPSVVTPPPSDELDDDDVPEFGDGDSDDEPAATDKHRPIVEEVTVVPMQPEEGVVRCSAFSLLFCTCIILHTWGGIIRGRISVSRPPFTTCRCLAAEGVPV